jgi:transmembrane sensor
MAVELKDHFEKIAAYLSGELTVEEARHVDNWRKDSPANETAFREAEAIWKHSRSQSKYPGDAATDWADLEKALSEKHSIPFWKNNWYRVAAAIIIVAVAGIWAILSPDQSRQLTTASVYRSEAHVETVTLPDSTMVWLNVNSSLEVIEGFGGSERIVVLNGEGYFKVKRNEAAPFIVFTKDTKTQVLGTAFDINATGVVSRISVAEGKVNFGAREDSDEAITLLQNEGAEISVSGAPAKFNIEPETIGLWRKENNTTWVSEKEKPLSFITSQYTYGKNTINQTVIRGTLQSKASVANYKNIVLKISYKKASGKKVNTFLTLQGPLNAGEQMEFEKRLLDLFSDTRDLTVEAVTADAF